MISRLLLETTMSDLDNYGFVEIMYKGFLGKYLSEGTNMSVPMGLFVTVASFVLCLVIAYLLGSINFSIIISSKFYKDDIRLYGSGNAGTTNMLRTFGKKAAIFTLIGDFLKGFISVVIARLVFGVFCAYTAGLFCIIGHAFPLYYKFKGGKGVAAAAGVVLALDYKVFLIVVAIFAFLVITTKFVSLGSIMAAMVFPILVYKMNDGLTPYICVIIALIIGGFIVFLHRENLKRLFAGKESKISFKKKENDDKQ